MKLHSKKRLLLAVASTALAAAVLLTGCGGDGGSGGGGGNPTPSNPTPVQPEEPKKDETTPEQKVTDPNESVKTADNITMSVTTGTADNKAVETVAAPNDMVYVPFNFNIKNESDKEIDLAEKTQTAAQKARSLVSTFSAEENYDDLFTGNNTAKNFNISLNGEKIDSSNTASVIQLYEGDEKRDGTVLKPGWRAEIKVVVKVPEAWSEPDSDLSKKPIKVTYNMPSEDVTDNTTYIFDVTPSGKASTNYSAFPDVKMQDYTTAKATLNGVSGELTVLRMDVTNTTRGVFHIRNTVYTLGGVTADNVSDGMNVDRIFAGTPVENVVCVSESTKTDKRVDRTVITAWSADHEGMKVDETGTVFAYIFIPDTDGKWTNLSFYYGQGDNAKLVGSLERTITTPDDGQYTQYPTYMMPTADDFTSTAETYKEQNGYLISVCTDVTNTTAQDIDFGNTLVDIGGTTPRPASVFGSNVQTSKYLKASVTLSDGNVKTVDVVTAIGANNSVLAQGLTARVYAFCFVPSDVDWTAITYLLNGQQMGRSFANKSYKPEAAAQLSFYAEDGVEIQKYSNGYLISKDCIVSNDSATVADLSDFATAEQAEEWSVAAAKRAQELMAENEKMTEMEAREQAIVEMFKEHSNDTVVLKGASNFCITGLENEGAETTLAPGKSVSVIVMAYVSEKADLEAYYNGAYIFTIRAGEFGVSFPDSGDDSTEGQVTWRHVNSNGAPSVNQMLATKWQVAVPFEVANETANAVSLPEVLSMKEFIALVQEYTVKAVNQDPDKYEQYWTTNEKGQTVLTDEGNKVAAEDAMTLMLSDSSVVSKKIWASVNGQKYPCILVASDGGAIAAGNSTTIAVYSLLPKLGQYVKIQGAGLTGDLYYGFYEFDNVPNYTSQTAMLSDTLRRAVK